jgi:hypothetical protein
MQKDAVIARLMNEFGYPQQGAALVWNRIENLSPQILPAFTVWWDESTIPSIEVNGMTFKKLLAEHAMNPVAVFLTLDWLAREPEKALASLKKGHDKITATKPPA